MICILMFFGTKFIMSGFAVGLTLEKCSNDFVQETPTSERTLLLFSIVILI